MSVPSDHSELILQMREGSSEAKEILCSALYPRVLEYVRAEMGQLRRWFESGDLSQQVTFEAVNWAEKAPEAPRWGQMLKAARRISSNRTRDAARRIKRERGESTLGSPVDSLPEGEDRNQELIRELVAELPPAYADIVRLCALERMSARACARQLGLDENTVRERYEHARKLIEKLVNE